MKSFNFFAWCLFFKAVAGKFVGAAPFDPVGMKYDFSVSKGKKKK